MRRDTRKLFVIRKFVMARSAADALKLDRNTPPDDVFVDDDWKQGKAGSLEKALGFGTS
jgi:hypothetical protein